MSGGDFGTTVEYEDDGQGHCSVIVDTGGDAAEEIGGTDYTPPETAANDN